MLDRRRFIASFAVGIAGQSVLGEALCANVREDARELSGAPVYNVGLPVLRRAFPDRPPFRVVEIPRELPGGGDEPPLPGPA